MTDMTAIIPDSEVLFFFLDLELIYLVSEVRFSFEI